MNYHTLSDFRTQHLSALEALLTQVLGCLDYAGLITYEHTAKMACGYGQCRRRLLSAGSHPGEMPDGGPSCRRGFDCGGGDTAPLSPGSQAARGRAATERVAHLEAALAELSAAKPLRPRPSKPKPACRPLTPRRGS